MREAQFLRLQIFCFYGTARGFPVTSDSFSKGSLSRCAVALLSLPPCGLAFVSSWAAALANRTLLEVTPAFSTAPFAEFSLARETHRSENQTALVTGRFRAGAILLEQAAALLNAQAHRTSPRRSVAVKIAGNSRVLTFRVQVWAGTTESPRGSKTQETVCGTRS